MSSMCENPATFKGLNEWYRRMFELLGWMVLSKEKSGMELKILNYMDSLNRLESKLKCKIETIRSQDKKDDLKIMLNNVKLLKKHVAKDFQ